MRTLIAAISILCCTVLLASPSSGVGQAVHSSVPRTDFLATLNQEALPSDPAAIHAYSRHLVDLLIPDRAGSAYLQSFTDRLARAEQMAREGKGHLVPEADVVRAYNQIVRQIGAPPSFQADEASVRHFRSRPASMGVLSALFSAGRNGAECNPGEAVLLVYLLVFNDGKLSEHMLDEFAHQQQNTTTKTESVLSGRLVTMSEHMGGLLTEFAAQHRRRKTIGVFDGFAQMLGL